jgi:membrane associated rhomboid family serine protease/tetratricopeptide (TPR) repeat protein
VSVSDYFEQHEEQAFVAKALAIAVAVILAKSFLSGLIAFLVLIFPVVFLVVLRLHAAASGVSATDLLREHITFFPMMRSESERLSEVKPWVTYGLILVNVAIFYGFELNAPENFISDNLIFLPNKPDLFNVPLSALTSIFLHASGGHLWGNMTFLWVVGTAIERRVGWQRFSWLYLLTGVVGGLVYIMVEFLAHGRAGHALGASGAIAGIMGIFAVRCYFKTMIFPLPILGIFSLILPISLKVKLNSLMIMALFFFSDLSGGIGQITGESPSMVGHWAHLGGMLSGMFIAGFLKLGDDAVEERHLEIGLKASEASYGYAGGERSMQIALDRNPENIDALLGMARLKTKFQATPEAQALYEKVLKMTLAARPSALVELFREYFHKFRSVPQDPVLVFRLAEALRQAGETDLCIECLERLVEMPGTSAQVREKALYQLATLLEFTSCFEAAQNCFARFAAEYPDSVLAGKARAKAGDAAVPTPVPKAAQANQPSAAIPTSKLATPTMPTMPTTPVRYRLVSEGTISFSCDPEETKEQLVVLLRCGRDRIDKLMSGRQVVLKRDLDQAAALRMKQAFERTGAICTIETEEAPGATQSSPAVQVASALTASVNAGALQRFQCPKCGFPQEKTDCCSKCGVYYAKLAVLAERELNGFRNQLPVS